MELMVIGFQAQDTFIRFTIQPKQGGGADI